MDATHHFRAGSFPLLISIPHHGSRIPPEMAATMTADGRSSRDTDWFLERLYDLPETEDASWLVADWSRYVIDLNRPASGESLYPGQTTTGLVPTTCFDGANIYLDKGPTEAEVGERISQYWAPYHQQLQAERKRLRDLHPRVVLLEAHSIASVVPRLFPRKTTRLEPWDKPRCLIRPNLADRRRTGHHATLRFHAGIQWPLRRRVYHARIRKSQPRNTHHAN